MNAKRLLPLVGVVAVILVVAGHLVHGSVPGGDDPVAKLTAFYRAHSTNTFVGSVLLAEAAFFLLAFAAVLRARLGAVDGAGGAEATFGFGGGVLFAAGLTLTGGIGVALGHADHLDPIAIQALHALFFNLFAPLGIGAAVFLIGNGLAVVRTSVLPTWLGWAAIPIGVLALVPEPIGDVGFLGLGIWVLVVSALLVADASPRRSVARSPGAVGVRSETRQLLT